MLIILYCGKAKYLWREMELLLRFGSDLTIGEIARLKTGK